MSLYYSPPPGGSQDSMDLFWGSCVICFYIVYHNHSLLQYVCDNVL